MITEQYGISDLCHIAYCTLAPFQGSDDDVNSDDLLYESGEEEEDSGGDALGAWDDEED